MVLSDEPIVGNGSTALLGIHMYGFSVLWATHALTHMLTTHNTAS